MFCVSIFRFNHMICVSIFRFNHYGSGSKKVPLQDVLSYALEFAQSKPEHASLPQDVEMESPKPHSASG